MVARVYGVTGTYTSHAAVTRGFVSGLQAGGAYAGTFSLNARSEWDADDDESSASCEDAGGTNAPVGVLTGSLGESHQMLTWGRHAHRMAMVAPNSSALPRRVMSVLNRNCTALLGPSGWACEVIKKYTTLPVYKAPHGLDPELKPMPVTQRGPITALHFSTSDRQRKGTFELVQAWSYLMDARKIPQDAKLKLVLNDQVIFANERRLTDLDKWNIEIIKRPQWGRGFSPEQMARVLSQANLLIQPSRGEGFGLQPLSALACGTPVVATDCTGHSEYLARRSLQDGFVRVTTGKDVPIDDLPEENSLAPELTWDAVAEAVGFAFDVLPLLKEAAMDRAKDVADEWSWARQLDSFSRMVKVIANE